MSLVRTMATSNGRKIPIPRRLDSQETAASLRLWKIHFVNYTRGDQYFAHFVKDTSTWTMTAEHWGFAEETAETSLKRSKAEMKSDCLMFLETLASYLPDDYLVEKITKSTGKLADVWTVIDSYYGVTLSSNTFLELAKMSKKKEETYRQFYLRMEGFVSKHLTKGEIKVEDVTSPVTGDILTISLKNVLVIMWMTKIHARLVDYVKVDFSQELKAGKELIELMGSIADNVDNILARHDAAASVSLVLEGEETDGNMLDSPENVFRADFGNPARGSFRGAGRGRGQGQGGRPVNNKPGKTLHCSHCKYLSDALKLRISTNHDPTECYRRDIAVRRLEGEEELDDSYEEVEDLAGELSITSLSSQNSLHFQSEQPNLVERLVAWEPDNVVDPKQCSSLPEPPLTDFPLSDQELWESVLKIQQDRHAEDSGTAQAQSPSLAVSLHNHHTKATIDEGATINCMALRLANRCDLDLVPTSSRARGADSSSLRIVGKTRKPVRLITTDKHGIPIVLQHVVVVEGLSADILIGEPGKRDCHIHTNATTREITIHFQNRDYLFPYLEPKQPCSQVARVQTATFVSPGKKNAYKWKVPEELAKQKHLHLQPRSQDVQWFEPGVYHVQHGVISLQNVTGDEIGLRRNAVFAEVRLVEELEVAEIRKVHNSYPDQFQYASSRDKKLKELHYVDKVKIDPDNILTEEEKQAFRQVCEDYKDIIRPEPGRYNGKSGSINNRINFHSRPAPNKRIYQQKLTDSMKQRLAEKMDKLHSYGVL